MKHKIVGIVVCTLLIVNTSAVLGLSDEKVNTNGEEKYYIFADPIFHKEIKYTIIDDKTGNEPSHGIISNINENLAPNPSFEVGCCTLPSGWIYSIDDTSKFHWDSKFSHTGGKSIGALNLTETTKWSCWITAGFIPVDFVKNTYEFSGWYKFLGTPTTGQYAAFNLLMYNEQYNYLGGFGSLYNFSLEWKYVSENTSGHGGSIINETKYVKLGLSQYYTQNEPNPSIEVRFDDLYFGFGNDPPNTPTIVGKTNGTIRTSYNYTIQTTDPEQNDVQYHIDWGDNTNTITDLYKSGEEIIVSHTWDTKDTYSVKIKAIDENYAESDRVTLTVTMPCNIIVNTPFLQLLQHFIQSHPSLFTILQKKLQRLGLQQ